MSGTRSNRLLERLGIKHPIVLAPMAGFSTPQLVAAVADAGGLAMLGAGMTPKEGLCQAVRATRALIRAPGAKFGVNLFVPTGFHVCSEQWTQAQSAAVEEAARRQTTALTELSGAEAAAFPVPASWESCEATFAGQIDALLEEGVQVASFHFGWPSPQDADRLHAAGVFLIGNATNLGEAQSLEQLGADAIIAQGLEAGGHRGTFINADKYSTLAMVSTLSLTRAVARAVLVPVIAAGGVMDGTDIAAALVAGASAAQLGTAFLTTAECAAPSVHKWALLRRSDAVPTVVTQAFTGKPARALANPWTQSMQDIEVQLPNCFNGMPAGRTLQVAAAKVNRSDVMYMWAGQEYQRCRPSMGASELMTALISERDAAVSAHSRV